MSGLGRASGAVSAVLSGRLPGRRRGLLERLRERSIGQAMPLAMQKGLNEPRFCATEITTHPWKTCQALWNIHAQLYCCLPHRAGDVPVWLRTTIAMSPSMSDKQPSVVELFLMLTIVAMPCTCLQSCCVPGCQSRGRVSMPQCLKASSPAPPCTPSSHPSREQSSCEPRASRSRLLV